MLRAMHLKKAFIFAGLAGLAVVGGCQKSPPPEVARPATPAPAAGAAATAAAAPKAKGPIAWIDDDLAGAQARAKAEGKPLFIDGWAPWCHTCLSMQNYVFTDAALAPIAGRFVWLAIDTEKPGAAEFLARYPMENYPTFFIVDPADGQVAGRWVGSMSTQQLRGFLEDGERTVQLAHSGQMDPRDPLALVRAGDKAALAGDHAEAIKRYAEAVRRAPAGWSRRTEALVGELGSMMRSGQASACVDLALAEMGKTEDESNAADLASDALNCADDLPASDARMAEVRKAASARLLALVQDEKAALTADDRGDIWRMLWDVREKQGDSAGAHAAAQQRSNVLEAAAAKAPDAEASSTFDWGRAESLLYLDHGREAVRLLEKSEAALSDDYNPPARLARVHYEMHAYGEALAAIDRALAKAYGPRKGTLLALKVDILDKQGRKAEAQKVAEEEIALYESVPQKRPGALAAARKRLAALITDSAR
jgi:hypothetical protein